MISGVAEYQWACSEPGDRGERYFPSLRDFDSDVLTNTTNGSVVNLYRAQPNTGCDGSEEVNAIDYCYQYELSSWETVFNWTVLIFEETHVFTVTKIYVIESRPSSLSGDKCMNAGGGRVKCCDRTLIEGFDLPMSNFIYGVTESARGNTAGATLLGFFAAHDTSTQTEYIIYTVQINRGGQNLSVGSTLPDKDGGESIGLRMIWFVIGEFVE